MTTKRALTIAMVVVAGATASILIAPPKSRPVAAARTHKVNEIEDPFAEMIQEGDGLLARWKAEAAEMAKRRKAA